MDKIIQFIAANATAFVSTVAALAAWIPFVVERISLKRRKLSATVVDYRIIEDASVFDSRGENKITGTILILVMNCFVTEKSLFAKDYKIKVFLNEDTQANGIVFDGETKEKYNGREKILEIPVEYNFNLHREIVHDKDNVRVFPLLFRNVAFDSVTSIEKIVFEFKGNKETKTLIIEQKDIPVHNRMGLIWRFMKDVQP